jgi:hypothetical protein
MARRITGANAMSECKHDMKASAGYDKCVWCGCSELEIAKATIAQLEAEVAALKYDNDGLLAAVERPDATTQTWSKRHERKKYLKVILSGSKRHE